MPSPSFITHTSLASIFTIMKKPMKALPKMSLHPPLIPYSLISVMLYLTSKTLQEIL